MVPDSGAALIRLALLLALAAGWTPHPTGTDASLRGLSSRGPRVCWATGSKGTVLLTSDGGVTWSRSAIPGTEELDFRDVEAVDDRTVFLMSAGPRGQSRVYRTFDAGEIWTLILNNPDAQGFFDAIAFWDRNRGLVLGDPVDGKFVLLRTMDGGDSWQRMAPAASANEGAFAASGTCLIVRPGGRAWFATGGPGGSRVFRSSDYGLTWAASQAPIRHEEPTAGIFSIAFADDLHGIVVGGNYSKPEEDRDNAAITNDGGKTWQQMARSKPRGYRSAVVYLSAGGLLATGPGGTDYSPDGGRSWSAYSDEGFHSLTRDGWASGSNGRAAISQAPMSGIGTGDRP